MWLTVQSKIQPDCLSVRLMKYIMYRQKCLRTDKQVYWMWDWHNIIPDSLKETLQFLLPCLGWLVYNICYSCQFFLYPCGQLPSLLPSTTDVRIIISSRKRIYRESLAEVRLGFFPPPRVSSQLCLLWRLKPEFWMVCMCIQAGEKCIQGFEPTWSITISVAFMKSMLDMCTTDFWSSWQSFCSILRHIWWSNCFTLHANVFLKRHTTLCVFHYFVVSL